MTIRIIDSFEVGPADDGWLAIEFEADGRNFAFTIDAARGRNLHLALMGALLLEPGESLPPPEPAPPVPRSPSPAPDNRLPFHHRRRGATEGAKRLPNRYPATCAICGQPIPLGTAIYWQRFSAKKGDSAVWCLAHGENPKE